MKGLTPSYLSIVKVYYVQQIFMIHSPHSPVWATEGARDDLTIRVITHFKVFMIELLSSLNWITSFQNIYIFFISVSNNSISQKNMIIHCKNVTVKNVRSVVTVESICNQLVFNYYHCFHSSSWSLKGSIKAHSTCWKIFSSVVLMTDSFVWQEL